MRRILNQLLLKTGTPPWHLQLPLSPGLHKYVCRVRVKRAEMQIRTRFCRIHFNVNGNRRVSKDKHLQFFLSPHLRVACIQRGKSVDSISSLLFFSSDATSLRRDWKWRGSSSRAIPGRGRGNGV